MKAQSEYLVWRSQATTGYGMVRLESDRQSALDFTIRAINSYDGLLEQRETLTKACERVFEDTGWCPVCEQHEHSETCPVALALGEAK